MICSRCLFRTANTNIRLQRLSAAATAQTATATATSTTSTRAAAFSTTSYLHDAAAAAAASAPRQGAPRSAQNSPSATSTSHAQPFSAPATPSPPESAKPKKISDLVTVQSSIAAGTTLKGLNFLKNKQDPVAMEDAEYPPWLWQILKPEGKKDAENLEADLYSKSKKQRRAAAKALRKQALLNPESLAPKVPLYEQTIDLLAGNGSVEGNLDAENARGALTKAMRQRRRAAIKEANFLRTMG